MLKIYYMWHYVLVNNYRDVAPNFLGSVYVYTCHYRLFLIIVFWLMNSGRKVGSELLLETLINGVVFF